MSVETFIQAIPKIELNLQLEGAIPRETMLMFADQNEVRDEMKRFDKWVEKYKDPDFKKLDELTEVLRSWIQYGDDLSRAVYDIGVKLSKDNVRYAEIAVNPLSFVTGDLTFDEFIEMLNDGRDRVERGWGVKIRWVMIVPRGESRYADEIARWSTSTTARDGGVVAIALAGYNAPKAATLDQFERAFRTAERKELARTAYLSERDDIDEAIDLLRLNTIVDGWGITESPETLESLKEREVQLHIGLWRAQQYGWVKDVTNYPFDALVEADAPFTITSDMPVLFGKSLTDEYLMLIEQDICDVDQIQTFVQRSLTYSHLPGEEAATLANVIATEFDMLREEHLTETEGAEE